jgi:hypothetical protein
MKRLRLVAALATLVLVPACGLPDLPVLDTVDEGGDDSATSSGPDGSSSGGVKNDSGTGSTNDAGGGADGNTGSPESGVDATTGGDAGPTEADGESDAVAPMEAGPVCVSGSVQCTSDTQYVTCDMTGEWGITQQTCTYACVTSMSATSTSTMGCGGVCVPGTTECASSTQQSTCDTTGEWGTTPTTCAYGCLGTVGTVGGGCGGVCTSGSTECSTDTQVSLCSSAGQWQTATTCTYACVGGVNVVGSNCGGACVPGAVACSSDTQYVTCDMTGTWGTTPASCTYACEGTIGAAGATCGGVCAPGTTECVTDTLYATCDATGNWSTTYSSCPDACVTALDTVPAKCGGVCVPGTTECVSDTQYSTCDTTGNWSATYSTCPDACTASVGAVPATCGGMCVPGTTECVSDTQYSTCTAAGQWSPTYTSCPDACTSAVDTVPATCGGVCVPGATQCVGTTGYLTCGTNGKWGATTTACTGSGATYCSISNGACGPNPNVMFVTTGTQTGSLGGLSGADAICQSDAKAAGLSGTFVAYLSTSTQNASARLVTAGGGASRGWVRTDGMPIADTAANLAAGTLWYPPSLDQTGAAVTTSAPEVWTGSLYTGVAVSGETCSDWTSTTSTGNTGSPWAGYYAFQDWWSGQPCSGSYRLYCLQVSQNVQVSVAPVAGRYAFITSGWDPGGGLSAADAQCQSAATSGSLPGTYLALLATTAASAASRFSTTGSTWVRPDGVPVFATASALNTFTFVAPLVVNATGGYQGNNAVWNGSTAITAVGTATTTCNNWGSNASSSTADTSRNGFQQSVYSSGPSWDDYISVTCDQTYPALYCLQE